MSSNEEVFGKCIAAHTYEAMKCSVILVPLNSGINKMNSNIIERFPGEYILKYSFDLVKNEPEGSLKFKPRFLNTGNLPPQELKIQIDFIIMLLRNIFEHI